MARLPRDRAPANTPIELDEDNILPSVERDEIVPAMPTRNTYSLDSDTDSEVAEIDYYVIPDDLLLNEEHADEPRSNLRSYTIPVEPWKRDIQSYQVNHVTLHAGGSMTVSFHNGSHVEYLTIMYLRQDLLNQEDVTLIGHRFLQSNHPDFGGLLDTTLKDEVAWVATDYPGKELRHLYAVSADSVIEQRKIAMTNALTPSGFNGTWVIHEDLVCRWKVILQYPKAARCKPSQSVVRKLQAAECDTKWCVPEDELQKKSRGETIKGGSMNGWRPFEKSRLDEEANMRQILPDIFRVRATQDSSDQSQQNNVIVIDESDNHNAGLNRRDRGIEAGNHPRSALQRPLLTPRTPSLFRVTKPRSHTFTTAANSRHQDRGIVGRNHSGSSLRAFRRQDLVPHSEPSPLANTSRRLSSIFATEVSQRPRDVSMMRQARQARPARPNVSVVKRYTFGDAFCGGGGVSRGAQMAGLSVAWGFDRGQDQCHTWSTNFPYAQIFPRDVTTFLGENIDVKVDILHLSPPCQPYSAANTRPNEKKDEANIAACFAISDLIKKCKPRLVTMENTSGLFDRKPQWFHRFINLFLAQDYSVRWSILDMANYGVPQSRQRLIIIAASPCDILPTFPPYTHAKVAAGASPPLGMAPWVSINAAINNIPPHCPDHDIHQAERRGNGSKPAPDGNSIAKCVTCKGGDNDKHPDGNRGYTNREFACLQTFPLYHEFRPQGTNSLTTIREQIGNAVPPRFAKVLLGWLKKSLEEADGVVRPEVMQID